MHLPILQGLFGHESYLPFAQLGNQNAFRMFFFSPIKLCISLDVYLKSNESTSNVVNIFVNI